MPKDATKNVDRYKVRGGSLNEYEYHKNQEQATTDKKQATDKKQMNTDKKPQSARKTTKKK